MAGGSLVAAGAAVESEALVALVGVQAPVAGHTAVELEESQCTAAGEVAAAYNLSAEVVIQLAER